MRLHERVLVVEGKREVRAAGGDEREREEARARWIKWWDETGRNRFVGSREAGDGPRRTT
jgi:hypothetical protein